MRRPGILSDADVVTPEAVEKDIAKDAGLDPAPAPAKWMGLPATVVGLPTKWLVLVGLAFGAAKAAKLV